MLKLTWRKAAAWRLRRQHLDRRADARNFLQVASRLCGLHAQVMSSAELTLWARTDNLDREAVQRALWQDRSLVKTWAMRGTLHLLPSGELPLWYAALGTSRRFLREESWKKYYGITLDELDRITEAIAAVLHERLVTREELAREVERITGSAVFQSKVVQESWGWGTLLRPAAFGGHLCFGPSVGQRVRFTHPRSWLASTPADDPAPIDAQTALKDVTRRFLSAYAPATDRDLARWWQGGGVSLGRQRIAALGDELAPVDIEGTRAWMLAGDVRKMQKFEPGKSVCLLPGFDQYVVAASYHAGNLMPEGVRARVYRPQGWISPVLLVNGFMQGTWRHTIQNKSKRSLVEVEIEPFAKIPAWVRSAANREAERLALFLGCELSRVKFDS